MIPRLDERLQAAADLFPVCEEGADIGADHGRLSCYLLSNNQCVHMQVTDISAESLKKAESLLRIHQLSSRAEFYVGDGLAALRRPVKGICICGIGGQVIGRILEEGVSHLHNATLVLSPQTDFEYLRASIEKVEYSIVHEEIVMSGGRFYLVMRALPGKKVLSPKEVFIGPCLMDRYDDIYLSFLLWRKKIYTREQTMLGVQKCQWLGEEIERVRKTNHGRGD